MSEEPEQIQSKPRRRSRMVQLASVLGLVAVLLLVWYFLGPKPNKAANRQRAEVVPVEIAIATTMDVPVQVKGIGNVESIAAVAVRSQVEGTLQAVHFTPGQEVKKGDITPVVYLYFERFQEWLQGEKHSGQTDKERVGVMS